MTFPKSSFLTGDLNAFQSDPLGFLTRLSEENEEVATFRLGPFQRVQLISDPQMIKEVLVTRQDYFVKSQDMKVLKSIVGNGLLTSEKEFHKKQRRLIQPAFKKTHIANYGQDMIDCTDDYIQNWKHQEARLISEDMMNITLGIICKTMFSMSIESGYKKIGGPLEIVMIQAIRRMRQIIPLPLWIPTKKNRQFKQSVKALDQVIYQIIENRRQYNEVKEDLLGILMTAKDEENNSRMTDKQLRDELMTIFLAGHETTANALTWTFYLLAQYPEVEMKLAAEIERVLGTQKPKPENFIDLPYTQQVISESLRLYPPAYVIGRKVEKDVTINGHHFKKGTMILISQYVMHRKSTYFPNPNEFIPERFEKKNIIREYAYFPFGGGPRVCIGNHFAMMEAVLVLATITQKYKLTFAENPDNVKPQPIITLRPKHSPIMLVEKR